LLPNFVLLHVFFTGLGENETCLFAALDVTFLGEVQAKIMNLTTITTFYNVLIRKKNLE